ncbi:TetR/AcrR family transcriptional regulator [Actinoplanes hulinensis]|uniref:TetR/AcrR family transcriptional regulator n=1 Tax=Actinoplanes hulinensis TaxID=1144547 RepID=A0ABS7BEM9_9ACTN|nr:TetR/AcrR family transcriptional regulator [Actinoplanes hulinensis]MBW6439334.1 TetR/AcrR family transcriptional regulator [Actinoplanes hulinensis]
MPKSREPLSTRRVLQAALALADSGGTDSLSMRHLGRELGVEAMSLYRHVANKEAVLDGIVDLVVDEIDLPGDDGDWKAAMRRRGETAHRVLTRHPWAPALLMSRTNTGPAMLRYIDFTLGVLRGAGFSWRLADYAWNTMDSYVYGFTLRRLNFPIAASDYADTAAAYEYLLAGGRYPHMAELTRQVAEGHHPGDPDITFGLDLILDGLEHLRDREATS